MKHNNPFDYFDRIFCINLDSRPDRWELAKSEFEKIGILERVERVTAITTDELQYDPRPRKNRSSSDLLGQFACASSHNKCTKLAIKYNAKNYLTFEDDFFFNGYDSEYLADCISELPSDWRLFLLGHARWNQKRCKSYSENLYKMNGFGLAHAYAINGHMFTEMDSKFEKKVIRGKTNRARWFKRNEWFLNDATKYQYGVKKIFAFQRDGFSDVSSINKKHS